MVDSIKVYTKTKEAAGWPEDSDESPDSSLPKSPSVPNVNGYSSAADVESSVSSPLPLTPMDKLVTVSHEFTNSRALILWSNVSNYSNF